jgi:hypothetical protein
MSNAKRLRNVCNDSRFLSCWLLRVFIRYRKRKKDLTTFADSMIAFQGFPPGRTFSDGHVPQDAELAERWREYEWILERWNKLIDADSVVPSKREYKQWVIGIGFLRCTYPRHRAACIRTPFNMIGAGYNWQD